MKFLVVILVLLALIVGLMSIINSRKNLEFQMTKSVSFENVKHKVASDVLKEIVSNIAEANTRLNQTRIQLQSFTVEVQAAQVALDGEKALLNTCNSDLSKIKSEISALEAQKSQMETEFRQKKDSLKQQIDNLKQEHQKPSKVCDYIIKDSTEGMKLCGIAPPPQAEQKPEPAKAAQ